MNKGRTCQVSVCAVLIFNNFKQKNKVSKVLDKIDFKLRNFWLNIYVMIFYIILIISCVTGKLDFGSISVVLYYSY